MEGGWYALADHGWALLKDVPGFPAGPAVATSCPLTVPLKSKAWGWDYEYTLSTATSGLQKNLKNSKERDIKWFPGLAASSTPPCKRARTVSAAEAGLFGSQRPARAHGELTPGGSAQAFGMARHQQGQQPLSGEAAAVSAPLAASAFFSVPSSQPSSGATSAAAAECHEGPMRRGAGQVGGELADFLKAADLEEFLADFQTLSDVWGPVA